MARLARSCTKTIFNESNQQVEKRLSSGTLVDLSTCVHGTAAFLQYRMLRSKNDGRKTDFKFNNQRVSRTVSKKERAD